MERQAAKTLQLRRAFPSLVAGFDLVGHEDPGWDLLHHAPLLLQARREPIVVADARLLVEDGLELGKVLGGDDDDDVLQTGRERLLYEDEDRGLEQPVGVEDGEERGR